MAHQIFVVSHCNAVFWFHERVRRAFPHYGNQAIYNSCCKASRVVIPPFKPRPEPLAPLARYDGDARCNKFMKT
jgi:hypothetical protein